MGDVSFLLLDTPPLPPPAPSHVAAADGPPRWLPAELLADVDVALACFDSSRGCTPADAAAFAAARALLPASCRIIATALRCDTPAAAAAAATDEAAMALGAADVVAVGARSGRGFADLAAPLRDAHRAAVAARADAIAAAQAEADEVATDLADDGRRAAESYFNLRALLHIPRRRDADDDEDDAGGGDDGGDADDAGPDGIPPLSGPMAPRRRRGRIYDTATLFGQPEAAAASATTPAAAALAAADAGVVRVAFVGLPNSGKSALLNALVGFRRCATSPSPGTTLGVTEVRCRYPAGGGARVTLVDTQGLGREGEPSPRRDSTGRAAHDATNAIIEAAHVVVVVIDACGARGGSSREGNVPGRGDADPLAAGEVDVMRRVVAAGRCLVVAANKWDVLASEDTHRQFLVANWLETHINTHVGGAAGATVVATSALLGRNVKLLLDAALDAHRRWSTTRVPTHRLNSFYSQLMRSVTLPLNVPKVRFLAQASVMPPTFVAYCSARRPDVAMPTAFKRFLTAAIRREFSLGGVPVHVMFRSSGPDGPDSKRVKGQLKGRLRPHPHRLASMKRNIKRTRPPRIEWVPDYTRDAEKEFD